MQIQSDFFVSWNSSFAFSSYTLSLFHFHFNSYYFHSFLQLLAPYRYYAHLSYSFSSISVIFTGELRSYTYTFLPKAITASQFVSAAHQQYNDTNLKSIAGRCPHSLQSTVNYYIFIKTGIVRYKGSNNNIQRLKFNTNTLNCYRYTFFLHPKEEEKTLNKRTSFAAAATVQCSLAVFIRNWRRV